MNEHKIPEGLCRCDACGEYNGEVNEKDLNREGTFGEGGAENSDELLSVSCLCKGIPCPRCKQNKINRPISNSYDAESNNVWHHPSFSGMRACDECQKKDSSI